MSNYEAAEVRRCNACKAEGYFIALDDHYGPRRWGFECPKCSVVFTDQGYELCEVVKAAPAPQEANKFDQGKLRYDLVPFDALDVVVGVLNYGAIKYGDRNWEKGMDPDRLIAAALRHISKHQQGEELDPESGLPHIAHAMCSLMFWLAYRERGLL